MEKTICVIGAARSGVAVSALLIRHGDSVILTDTREYEAIVAEFPQIEEELKALPADKTEKIFGRQIEKERIADIDEIVISPGIPLGIPILLAAKERGIPVISEVELAFSMTKTPFIAITGTNGKTTTTSLTGEIFKASGRKTYTVGNIGDPISNYIDEAAPEDVFVAEISSNQLDTCYQFKPKGAALLNLSPDHLDRYIQLEKYYAAKARIFQNQDESDFLVLNADDPEVLRLAENARARKLYFSLKGPVEQGAYLNGDEIVIRDGSDIHLCTVDELGIKGPHNVMNALAAAALTYFAGVDPASIREAVMAFKGVAHRQERFADIDGVEYINDSKGTNTNASITALQAMTRPTILIAGGYDKKEDYNDFIAAVKEKVKLLILLGKTADDIENCARANGFDAILRVKDYDEAVQAACRAAVSGDVVLLSPACASWDMFDNFEDRGDLFKELVQKYGSQ
jgi:UDP-N-acetylmuramoylalanine--D-glutamate ligase